MRFLPDDVFLDTGVYVAAMGMSQPSSPRLFRGFLSLLRARDEQHQRNDGE
jgi:hypothetical protein